MATMAAAPRTRPFAGTQRATTTRRQPVVAVRAQGRSEVPLVQKAAGALVAVAGAALLTLGSAAPAPAAQNFLVEAAKDPVGASKTAAKDLQRRSDNTFRDINSSPAKTGNEEDALRPDLQTPVQAYDKAADATRAVGDKLSSAPAALGKGFDKLGRELNPDIDFNSARESQAQKADAVGRDAREKSERVFEGLKEKLQNPLGQDRG